MTGVPQYSTTPASNINANTGVNWDEGMSPSAVNNSARQNMTDLRNFANDLIWFEYGSGTSPKVANVYASGTSTTIAGVDVTIPYHAGRRVKAVGVSTGTIYGTISSSSFSTNTTINYTWDSGSLSSETLTVYLSQIQVTGLCTGTGKPVLATSPTVTTPNIVGSATNDAASAGSVGEFVEATIAAGSAIAYTAGSGNPQNVMSISLTAGDWDVEGVLTAGGTGAVSNAQVGINSVSATMPSPHYETTNASVAASWSLVAARRRFSLSTTTTIYLVAIIANPQTNTMYGYLNARRVR
jgi:hypothetical protein